ncbi:MAG: hypothetical protein JETT_2655 [Candidatus Jettenia ecosi]|uniref:Uncharacterized protein n=1 Tax=Candidatus Jettenia ecosi TaxID=2494326 RepID=A0A533Q8S4_9BACT|nr:MAG: hypothetical protein JETT_2655 [Candidatus Jettenia ecosi]
MNIFHSKAFFIEMEGESILKKNRTPFISTISVFCRRF